MNQIEYEGKMRDVYTLRTCRKFIQAIADGTKTIETRAVSAHNSRMFEDPRIVAENEEAKKNGGSLKNPVKPVYFLRLHDQHGVEVLCRIDANGVASTRPQAIKYLQEKYNFHEFDGAAKEYEDYGDDALYVFFFFHIAEVLETKGI